MCFRLLLLMWLIANYVLTGGNPLAIAQQSTLVLIKYDIFSRFHRFDNPPNKSQIVDAAGDIFSWIVFEPVQVLRWIPSLFDYAELNQDETIANGTKILLQDVRELELLENYNFLIKSAPRDETALRQFLLQWYDPQVWPWMAEGKPCQTQMLIQFHKILGVDMPTGLLSSAIWFKQSWNDPRLVWDPSEWNGIQTIYFKDEEYNRGELWTPGVELWNGEEPSWYHLAPQQFSVRFDGTVTWIRNGKFVVACNLRGIGGFPYDRMVCVLEFGSWNYLISEVNLTLMRDGYTTGICCNNTATSRSPYQEYDIESIEAIRHVYNEQFPVLLYRLHLRRQHIHYTTKIIIPQAILTCVGFGSFWLHPTSGERMGLAITVPVANAVYDLMMYDQLPTSREIVFIATFGIGSFLFSMVTVMETILVMHLAYKSNANWFNPIKQFTTLRYEISELADWTLLLQYMEKRVNPPVKRTSTILMRLQSIRGRGGGSRGEGGVWEEEEQSSSCSKQAINSEVALRQRRKWRHQDSCTLHRDHRLSSENFVIDEGTIFEEVEEEEEEEEQEQPEFFEACSQLDTTEIMEESQNMQSPFKSTSHERQPDTEQQANSRSQNQNRSSLGDTVFHRTAEEARRFVDRLLKMEIPSKGSPALQQAARRALSRHGYARLEHRLLGILGFEDIGSALRRIDPRSYQDAVSSEYNLRWQAIGRLLDSMSQWVVVLGYFLFCFITYTVVLVQSKQTPHDILFDS